MISVKLNLSGDAVEITGEDLKDLDGALNSVIRFINSVNASDRTERTHEPEPMFTKEELSEQVTLQRVNPETAAEEAARVFNTPPQPPVPPISIAPEVHPVIYPGAELDSEGKPWNPDIHSRTKSKGSDGRWKLKRGLTPPVNAAPQPPAPPVPPAAVPPAPVLQQAINNAEAFNHLMQRISARVVAKQLTHDQVAQIVNNVGVESIIALKDRTDLIPAVRIALETIVGGTL
jgi:hypothetical protein